MTRLNEFAKIRKKYEWPTFFSGHYLLIGGEKLMLEPHFAQQFVDAIGDMYPAEE